MQSTTRRKVVTVAVASLMALALASGSAFAGRGVGGDNGSKNGTDGKKVSVRCPDGYELLVNQWGNAADINNNGAICLKSTGNADGNSYIDDTSGKWVS
jgi:hypothetical protein